MFSCCRCVNPKSPKYKKKGIEDDDSSGEGNKDPCQGENLSSEEEIKVEIIETEEKPVDAEPAQVQSQPCDVTEAIVADGGDSSSGEKVSAEQQEPSYTSSPKTSPNKSSTSSEQQQPSVVQDIKAELPASTDPVCPVSTNGSTADIIPTTVAEMEDAGEITANDSSSGRMKCEENGAIVEQPKISTISPTKSEPEPEEKSDHNSNDDSHSSDTDNISSENLEQTSEIEIVLVPEKQSPEIQPESDGTEVEPDIELPPPPPPVERIQRLQSDTSNSQTTIEETIDVQSYLSKESESKENSQLEEAISESDKENSIKEMCTDDNLVPKTAPDKAVADSEEPISDVIPENTFFSSSVVCEPAEPNENCQNPPSRKESANSDDSTTRTQLSFKESCLSRRSSSKSSIKKKVAYNDSTEIIPPPEYSPAGNDDDEVFSDSIPPRLPRGNMCAPYATKRGSLPGLVALPDWFAEDRLMMEEGGIMEPPTTPIGRDELALRRHRFFSDLLNAAHAAVEHRVRFDPLGPIVAKEEEDEVYPDCDPDLKPSSSRELEHLIDRLERIVDRLERTVSARELEETRRILKGVCDAGKAVVSVTDEATGTDEDEKLLDSNSNSDLPTVLPSTPPPSASYLHQQLDSLEATLFPELNSVEPTAAKDQPQVDHSLDTLPTVIAQVVLDNSISSNNSNDQEQNSVLEIADYPPPDEFCSTTQPPPTDSMSVNAYEDILLGTLANFLALSEKIGGDVAQQADLVKLAFNAQFAFVRTASESSAPSNNDLQNLLKPTSDQIAAIQSFREKHRTSQYFNHLSAVSESIPALGWVCVAPTPGPYVKEMNDAGQFYTNRVLKDWKEKSATHVEWARAWIQTLTELQQYIKQHHTTGLVWAGKSKPVVGGAGVPPPPPPCGLPPPPPMMPLGDVSAAGGGDDRSALFAQINQGEDITKGLKKVTSEMQTHKNPSLRSGPAPYKAPAGITNGTKPVSAPVTKPPSFVRDGKKWLIEYQKGNSNLMVEDAEMNNVVYMFRCENSTLTIKGKINSVVMDSCKKCSLVFDSLVASAEFVNCQSVQMQVLGKVPTISIDKTDGCQMYLSADSLDVEIVSSKSSEMNVMIPKGTSGDYVEQPIPEQFKTLIKGESLNTTCVESLG